MGDGGIKKQKCFLKTQTVCHLTKAGNDNQIYFIKYIWK